MTKDQGKTASEKQDETLETEVKKANKGIPGALKPIILLVVIAIIIVVGMRLLSSSSSNDASVGDAKLKGIQTYLSKSGADQDKKAQTSFTVGDPIQVGFSYEGADEESDEFVRFTVVQSESNEEAFKTNLFKLNPNEAEFFVSINNTNLPASKYKVLLIDSEDAQFAELEFEIVAEN